MHPFFYGVLSFLLPGIILLGTFFITHGSMDGLFGVLGGGSSVFAFLLLNAIARDG